MKKVYTTPEYKHWHNRKSYYNKKKRPKGVYQKNDDTLIYSQNSIPRNDIIKLTLYAPSDLRLLDNTEECLLYFRNFRSGEYLSKKGNVLYLKTSLEEVTQIDYGTISILTAIVDDFKFKRIVLKGDFPTNKECLQLMIDSGFLDHVLDGKTGKKFPKSEKSEMYYFEKGSGKLSLNENIRIGNIVKNVVQHLTGELSQCLSVKSIILEICGNSIEWGGTENRLWLLGVKYESEKVVFTVADVGRGILDSLHRKFRLKLDDIFKFKKNDEILLGAFEQKYGSSSREVNRNKGLPAVKNNFDMDYIRKLKVLTNNVILHFDDHKFSRTFEIGSPRFKGTFYQWEMTTECLKIIH